jgi:hypothetical protein
MTLPLHQQFPDTTKQASTHNPKRDRNHLATNQGWQRHRQSRKRRAHKRLEAVQKEESPQTA